MKYQNKFCVVASALAVALLSACGKSEEETINEVQFGMTSAAVVAQMAAMSMEAVKSGPSACVVVKTGCQSYPCTGAVTINLGASCPLPLGGAATGTVEVTGQWSSVDSATMSQTFGNTHVGVFDKNLAVASVMQLKSTRSANKVTVKYTAVNALAAGSGGALAIGGSATWDVEIDTKGTPDPADDRYTVEVTSAGAGAGFLTSARVVSVKNVVLDPSCRFNPIAGSADITEVNGFIPKIIKIDFHSTCDGKAEINGKTTELQLLP